jgi:hypothetical protein
MVGYLLILGVFVNFFFFSKKVFILLRPSICMEITTQFLVQISLAVLSFAIVVILASLAYLFLSNKKTIEEKKATNILNKIEQLKKVNFVSAKNSKADSTKSASIKGIDFDKTDSSLKGLLIKKFKPKIESQLGSKVNILEFNSIDNKLTALIQIVDVKILLSLDSSGKIIDYKKVE